MFHEDFPRKLFRLGTYDVELQGQPLVIVGVVTYWGAEMEDGRSCGGRGSRYGIERGCSMIVMRLQAVDDCAVEGRKVW